MNGRELNLLTAINRRLNRHVELGVALQFDASSIRVPAMRWKHRRRRLRRNRADIFRLGLRRFDALGRIGFLFLGGTRTDLLQRFWILSMPAESLGIYPCFCQHYLFQLALCLCCYVIVLDNPLQGGKETQTESSGRHDRKYNGDMQEHKLAGAALHLTEMEMMRIETFFRGNQTQVFVGKSLANLYLRTAKSLVGLNRCSSQPDVCSRTLQRQENRVSDWQLKFTGIPVRFQISRPNKNPFQVSWIYTQSNCFKVILTSISFLMKR